MTKQELLEKSLIAFREKFGVCPKDQGLIFCGNTNRLIVFASTKEACVAFIKAQRVIVKTVKQLSIFALVLVACVISGIVMGVKTGWTSLQWNLLVGGAIFLVVVMGYISIYRGLQLDRLKSIYKTQKIVTLVQNDD